MQQGSEHGRLKGIMEYIRRALKFYDLKQDNVAPVLFTIIFVLSFSGTFIPGAEDFESPVFIIYNIISMAGIYLASLIYQQACIKDLKGEKYTLRECTGSIFSRVLPLLAASLIFLLGTALGFLLLFVPGVIFNLMFLFYTCFIIDKKTGMLQGFRQSKRLTQGRKLEIFSIVLLFNFIILLPILLIATSFISPEDTLIFSFVLTFASGMTNLMQQRLIALIYVDLEYGDSTALE